MRRWFVGSPAASLAPRAVDRPGAGRAHARRGAFAGAHAGLRGLPGPLLAAVIAIAYFALAQYVIWLNDPVNAGAGYWPAAGVTLAALLLLPVRRWTWVVVGAAVAEAGGDLLHHYPAGGIAWWTAGNVAGPLVGAVLLRRFGGGGHLTPLQRLVPFLLFGVVTGPLVSAIIGSTGTAQAFGRAQTDVLFRWWPGDALGVLVWAPLLLCPRERRVVARSRLEFAVIIAAVTAVTLLAFREWHVAWDVVLPYLVLPVLMLAGVRLGIRGAAVAGFVVAELANLATALDYGPFRLLGDSDEYAVTVLQVFLAATLVATLVIATLAEGAQ